jgi:glutamate racemase
LIEQEQLEGPEIELAIAEYLLPMKKQGVDAIVLGCTHYPLVSSVIEKIIGNKIVVIDPARETGLEAQYLLQQQKQLSSLNQGNVRLCFSADVERAKRIAGFLFDTEKVEFELVNLEKFAVV